MFNLKLSSKNKIIRKWDGGGDLISMRKENGDEKVKIIDTISSLIFNIHLNINSFEMKMSFKKGRVLNYISFFFSFFHCFRKR